ncbi:MAG TPA: glycogen synthase GlgA [Candidatus Binataceae bacterium]|nr:glycogen synthase GlgA [Candidatus Binataceae bacterium]
MKIAIVAAEISPWAKVGGLADVIGALPAAFKDAGAEPAVIVPGYKSITSKLKSEPIGSAMTVHLGAAAHQFRVLRAEDSHGVPIYLIDHPEFFARDGVYGDHSGEFPDNPRRFVFFGKAAAMAAAEIVKPDVLHAHDWHAAAAPIVARADAALRERFARTTVAFTIHNLAFQGICAATDFPLLGIDSSYFGIEGLEFFGHVNLMKGAIVLADGASTVSPTYAREVTADPELGFGLEGVLRHKGERFTGILNGADYREWNPAHDNLIAARYTPAMPDGKRVCARDLRYALELPGWDDRALIGMVTRLTTQKGCDLLRDALDDVMEQGVQLVMLASGDKALEEFFSAAQKRYPDQFRVISEFDNPMAHRIQAGCDAFLMPSRFEPCGLTQMYALKYGAVPIVRATGGLRDTVSEFDPATGRGTGFVFDKYDADELVAAVKRMTAVFAKPPAWRKLMANCFAQDFSWAESARSYLDWFASLANARGQA